MINFHIQFIDKLAEDDDREFQLGQIKIFNFVEVFRASLSYWDRIKYINQWREGLERLLQGNERSCLVSSMYDPTFANFIFWWVLYLENDSVYIQNQILFLDEIEGSFDEHNIYAFIRDRSIVSEDGNKISEWNVGVMDIRNYLEVFHEYNELF